MKTKLFEMVRSNSKDIMDIARAADAMYRAEGKKITLRRELKKITSVIDDFLCVFKGPPDHVDVDNCYYFGLCARRREILNSLKA
jgi:hypothetical protein